jgi:hypothetical protein
MMYYPTAYVAVIFPRFDAAANMKTDLMSKLEFLQLLAELGEEGLVLPDHHTGSTHQIKNSRETSPNNFKRRNRESSTFQFGLGTICHLN